jgi:3-oxoacyl-[acyl-carrier protein] reductase
MKRAVVTSATSSIGKVIAQTLANAGYELVLHYTNNEALALQLASELKATVVRADFTHETGVDAFIQQLQAQPKFDVIINNAGVSRRNDDKNFDEWDAIFHINALAPAVIMGHANELIQNNGVIVNMSSIYGDERFGFIEMKAYDASKAALNSLTRTFAKQLAPRIRVNAIAPGYVDSRWNETLSTEERQKLADEQLMRKFVTPQQVADLVLHIISNEGLDGEIIYLDGGQSLKTI